MFFFSFSFAQHPANSKGGGGHTYQGNREGNIPGINGKVMDESSQAIPFASVAVYSLPDEKLIKGTATDENGRFFIPIKPGTYTLKISFLSYREKTINNIEVTAGGFDAGVVQLTAGDIALDEVEVRGEKSEMQLQLDKRVFNVGKDITKLGSNVVELLDNVPSVTVSVEGNVALRGSENVRILIDGKPSGLTGISSTEALRNLQSSLVDRVEVITNPSARYDAEGEVGIINIVLKKNRRDGFNGSFDVKAGWPHHYGLAYNLNYRKNKVNLFTNYGLTYREGPGGGKVYTEIMEGGDIVNIYNTEREHVRGGLANNLQFGVNYFLNSSSTLTASGLYNYSIGRNNATVIYSDMDENANVFSTTTRTDKEKEPRHEVEAALNYQKRFKRKGHEWSVDAKWILRDDTEETKYTEANPQWTDILQQRSDNVEDERTYLIQTDYVLPFAKDGKFETGLRGNFRNIQNVYKVEQLNDNIWEVFEGFKDELFYTENIYAAYLMAGNKTGNFSYQGGIRAEYSDITTELKSSNEINPRDYLNWFPSVHLAYELPQKNTVQLSYSRRLSRPRFWYLLPFFTFSDSRNIFRGNPNLNPEYTDAYELGYLKNHEKGSFLATVYYRHRTGVIERVIIATDDAATGFTERFPINMATQNNWGVEMNIAHQIMDKWRTNLNVNTYRAITEGEYEGKKLYSDTYTWNGRLSTKINLPYQIDFQTSFNYRSPEISTQGKRLSMYSWDAGLSKDVLKGKGTITLTANDLLNTRKRRYLTETESVYSKGEFQWRARQILLSFNYRLKQQKKRGGGYGGNGGGDF